MPAALALDEGADRRALRARRDRPASRAPAARTRIGSSLPLPNGASRAICWARSARRARHRKRALDRQIGGAGRQRRRRRQPLVQERVEIARTLAPASENPAAIAWPPPVEQNARLPRRDHRRAEIEPRHRAARPLRHPVGDRRDAGRAVEALLDPAGDDADHAGMPVAAADQQHRVPGRRLRLRGQQTRRPASTPRPPGAAGSWRRAWWRARGPRPDPRQSSSRSPRSASLIRPAALMRGPRPKPQVDGVEPRPASAPLPAARRCRAARAAPSPSAPGRPARDSARSAASRRRPSPARPDRADRADPARPGRAKKPRRRSARTIATAVRNATAAAQSMRRAGAAIQPVRVDGGRDRRRRPFRLVVIQHHHVGPPMHRRQRNFGRGAAIDADDQRGAARDERDAAPGAFGP